MENSQWAFLKSPRFWALVIGAVALALFQDHVIDQAFMTAITTITGGFIAIRTVDRLGEKMGNDPAPKPTNDQSEV